MDVQDGIVLLLPEQNDYVAFLAGWHKGIWRDVDTKTYLPEERAA